MIEQEIARLRRRQNELQERIIPDLERRTERLYAHIMMLEHETEERTKYETEYDALFKELRVRSDEALSTRREIERLELQRKTRVRR